jgi:hypothetical protein
MRWRLHQWGPGKSSGPADFQIALENPPGRAYTEYVNSVMLTMSI